MLSLRKGTEKRIRPSRLLDLQPARGGHVRSGELLRRKEEGQRDLLA
jgi:hypothetical protein